MANQLYLSCNKQEHKATLQCSAWEKQSRIPPASEQAETPVGWGGQSAGWVGLEEFNWMESRGGRRDNSQRESTE